jgi:transposase
MDLRQRVLADCDAGMGTEAVAAKYTVSPAWVRRLKRRRRQTGETGPRPPRNRRKPALADHLQRIGALIAAAPDLTPAEIRDRLALTVSLSTLWAAVRGLGLTVKKKCCGPASGTART